MTETENVATYARIRPYNPAINEDKRLTARAVGEHQILNQNNDRQDTYNFTRVYDMKDNTFDLFETAMKPLLDYKILQGINSIFIVYGQSGSGKSFTLIGEKGYLGVLPLSLQYLLQQDIVERIDIASIEAYGIKAAKIGFYDLVSQLAAKSKAPKKYDPYSTKDNSRLNSENAQMLEITKENCLKVITELQAVSHMAPTLKNPHSSRGHTVYFCQVKMRDLENVYFIAVDLAGSEGQTALGTKDEFINGLKLAMSKGKLKLNKKQISGFEQMYKTRSLEAGCINNGLTQLQTIFGELIRKKISKSKGLGLRKVLSSFISLKSAYAILFTLSASANNNKVTRATLNFAKQTQLVKVETQKAKKKIDKDAIIKELNLLINTLRADMEQQNKYILQLKTQINDTDNEAAPLTETEQKEFAHKLPGKERHSLVLFQKLDELSKQLSEAEAEEAVWTVSAEDINAGTLKEDDMKEIFDQFDTDCGGSIDAEELQNALQSMGKNLSMEEVNELIEEIDIDGNGEVDFEEFQLMAGKAWFVDAFQSTLVEQMQKALQSAMAINEEKDGDIELYEDKDNDELIEEIQERKQTIMDLQNELQAMKVNESEEPDAYNESSEQLLLEIRQKEESIEQLESCVEDMQIEINAFKNVKQDMDEKAVKQTQEISKLLKEIESGTDMQQMLVDLEGKMDAMQSVNNGLNEELIGVQTENKQIKIDMDLLQDTNESLQSEMDKNNELEERINELGHLEGEFERLQTENVGLQNDLKSVAMLKMSMEQEMEDNVKQSNGENNKLLNEIEILKEGQQQSNKNRQDLEKDMKNMKYMLLEFEGKMDVMQEENQELKMNVSLLENDLKSLTISKINVIKGCNEQINLLRKGVVVYQRQTENGRLKFPFSVDFKWED